MVVLMSISTWDQIEEFRSGRETCVLERLVYSAKTITALALASAGDQIRADLQEQS